MTLCPWPPRQRAHPTRLVPSCNQQPTTKSIDTDTTLLVPFRRPRCSRDPLRDHIAAVVVAVVVVAVPPPPWSVSDRLIDTHTHTHEVWGSSGRQANSLLCGPMSRHEWRQCSGADLANRCDSLQPTATNSHVAETNSHFTR